MRTAALLLLVLGAAGCASDTLEVTQMPQRDADLYPWAQTQAGITVTVDEIADPARVTRYFGADLLEEGVLPVTVVVSNHGVRGVRVGPADVLLLRGRAVIDPLPVGHVADIAKRAMGRLRAAAGREVDNYFAGLALRATTVAPKASYQGVLFFPKPPPVDTDRFLSRLRLHRGGPRMHVGVTDVETQARLRYGPFRLTGGERQPDSFGAWWY